MIIFGMHFLIVSVVCFSLFFFTSCGKKNRSIFSFPTEKKEKINTLNFPSVHCVKVECVGDHHLISWQPVVVTSEIGLLVGYEVYRLNKQGFIPRAPLNAAPLETCSYIDQAAIFYKSAYVVRAVFKKNNQQKRGPASQVTIVQE
ncbi:hypothetical protein IPF37_05470 [bacterium]|nr:MAG: hypothetical protein IPF37_05470 [bacterium]